MWLAISGEVSGFPPASAAAPTREQFPETWSADHQRFPWNKTPHEVFLTWFGDVLSILSENGIGFALWEFRGSFGVLDSGREDVDYEDWHGHKLDRKLLNLLTDQ